MTKIKFNRNEKHDNIGNIEVKVSKNEKEWENMDSQKLIEFKGELEAIATYGNETITQKEFKD